MMDEATGAMFQNLYGCSCILLLGDSCQGFREFFRFPHQRYGQREMLFGSAVAMRVSAVVGEITSAFWNSPMCQGEGNS